MARESGGIFSSIRFPSPSQIAQDIQDWVKTQGVWWATSVTAHAVGISALLLLGSYAAEIIDEAPKFEAVQT